MLNRVLQSLLRNLVHGAGDLRIELKRGIDMHPQSACKSSAQIACKLVQRGPQARTLHGRRVQLVAEFADLLHHGAQQVLDSRNMCASLGRNTLQIHAHQVKLQAQRRQILPDGIVQESGNPGPLEVLGFERAQDCAAQFLFGATPGSALVGGTAGVANLPLHTNGKHHDVPDRIAMPLAQDQRLTLQSAGEPSSPGIAGFMIQRLRDYPALQLRGGLSENSRSIAVDALEYQVCRNHPLARRALFQQQFGKELGVFHEQALSFARENLARGSGHIAGHQAVLVEQFVRLAGFRVAVAKAHEFHYARIRLGHHLGHSHTQPAIHQVLLGHHNRPGLSGGAADGFAVQRLHGVHINDARLNASAASKAWATSKPLAIIVTSRPSATWIDLPISNFWSAP